MEIKAAVIQLRNFWKMSLNGVKRILSYGFLKDDVLCTWETGRQCLSLLLRRSLHNSCISFFFFVFFLGLTKCIIIMIIVIFSLLLKDDMRYLHVIGGRYITSWKFLGHACMIEGCCLCVIFIYFYFPIYLQFNQCVMLRVLLA